MTLRPTLRLALLLAACVWTVGCAARDPLPGPAIQTYAEMPAGDPGDYQTSRSRGVMEIYLTPDKPSHTIWNGSAVNRTPWGTIALNNIAEDGAVTVTLGDEELTARVGRAFPGTGIHVVASSADLGTALLRTRVIHTHTVVPRPSAEEARAVDRLPVFLAVRPRVGGQVYLEADHRPTGDDFLAMHLSICREAWSDSGVARPGDMIHVALKYASNSGSHWFVYLGPSEDGRLLFYEHASIHDILPDRRVNPLVVVAPYGEDG